MHSPKFFALILKTKNKTRNQVSAGVGDAYCKWSVVGGRRSKKYPQSVKKWKQSGASIFFTSLDRKSVKNEEKMFVWSYLCSCVLQSFKAAGVWWEKTKDKRTRHHYGYQDFIKQRHKQECEQFEQKNTKGYWWYCVGKSEDARNKSV